VPAEISISGAWISATRSSSGSLGSDPLITPTAWNITQPVTDSIPGVSSNRLASSNVRSAAPSATTARSESSLAARSITVSAPLDSPSAPIRPASERDARNAIAPAASRSQSQPYEFGEPSLSPRPRESYMSTP
jgi:hypothetical protein